jgi:hypothetical protein
VLRVVRVFLRGFLLRNSRINTYLKSTTYDVLRVLRVLFLYIEKVLLFIDIPITDLIEKPPQNTRITRTNCNMLYKSITYVFIVRVLTPASPALKNPHVKRQINNTILKGIENEYERFYHVGTRK